MFILLELKYVYGSLIETSKLTAVVKNLEMSCFLIKIKIGMIFYLFILFFCLLLLQKQLLVLRLNVRILKTVHMVTEIHL